MRILNILFLPVLLLMMAQSGLAAEPMTVFVSITPQKYFVQQIGKDLVDVRVMVSPGASPHAYEPKPGQLVDLSKTRVYFAIGVPFENTWLKKIAATNPKMAVVQTDQGIEKIPMAAHHHHEETAHHQEPHQKEGHDHKADHEHANPDPHIWLSPPLVKIQAQTILTALREIDPSHRSIYETNYNQFISGINELDNQLKTLFSGQKGLRFMVFHPAWGYFAHAYGLEQVPVEIQGKDPKPAQLKSLIGHARKEGIHVVFVQPQFSTKSAELIAREIGGQVSFADPLAEDWIANLRDVAVKFRSALK